MPPRAWVAEFDEAEAVARLLVAFRDHNGSAWPSDNSFLASVERLMEDRFTEFLLGAPDDDSPPMGVSQLRYRYSIWTATEDCWLEDLFVAEEARGHGLGSALVELALERARERDCRRVELDTNEHNDAALRLYERHGFSATDKNDGEGRTLFLGVKLQPYPPEDAVTGAPVIEYAVDGRIARLTLNRPERGNGLTTELIALLAQLVERADLDPAVHVLLLAGNGKGFCGGYDLVASAEGMLEGDFEGAEELRGTALDPTVMGVNHDPSGTWDPMVDYAMMSRNVRAFMTLFHCSKPVVCKVHGFCVAGGTDLALCSDLLVIADDAKIGYPPARVWGSPTTSMWAHRLGPMRAKRLLFTGDTLSGAEALEWGLAAEAPPASELDARVESLVARIAQSPLNQLQMMKLLVNQQTFGQGLHATQVLGTVFDGITRHTAEGYAFQQRAAEAGFKQAVHERDDPYGDFGPETSGVVR